MADKEFIIGLLEQVRRRVRGRRRLIAVSSGLSIALLIPVAFKLIDLVAPIRGITVLIILSVWGIATAVFLIWKARGHETMIDAAASLDRLGQMQDQMKTAYWFIRHPSQSEWVDAAIQKAAHNSKRLKTEALYPNSIPPNIYRASLLLVAFVLLN